MRKMTKKVKGGLQVSVTERKKTRKEKRPKIINKSKSEASHSPHVSDSRGCGKKECFKKQKQSRIRKTRRLQCCRLDNKLVNADKNRKKKGNDD